MRCYLISELKNRPNHLFESQFHNRCIHTKQKIKWQRTDEGLILKMPALTQEIGSVTWVLTQKSFSAKMITAKEKVLEGIKAESLKVIKKEK